MNIFLLKAGGERRVNGGCAGCRERSCAKSKVSSCRRTGCFVLRFSKRDDGSSFSGCFPNMFSVIHDSVLDNLFKRVAKANAQMTRRSCC